MDTTNVTKISIFIELMSKETVWGYVYLKEGERLQDLMNDSRLFLPVAKEIPGKYTENKLATIMINKQTIATIEER